MKQFVLAALILFAMASMAQTKTEKIMLTSPKFSTGDNAEWEKTNFTDAQWKSIKPAATWENQGYANYDGYAWYRYHFFLPSSFKSNPFRKDSLLIYLGAIDDADQAFFNGSLIGKTGSMPDNENGFSGQWEPDRYYAIAASSPFINWDGDNVIAVRVYDGSGPGGMYNGTPFIQMVDMLNIITEKDHIDLSQAGKLKTTVTIQNKSSKPVEGILIAKMVERASGKVLESSNSRKMYIGAYANSKQPFTFKFNNEMAELQYSFKVNSDATIISAKDDVPYILTPKAPLTPRINGAEVYGVRPGSPFLYRIPASGEKPITFGVKNLPKGLSIDKNTGTITGMLEKEGDYKVVFTAKNKRGAAERNFIIKCGSLLALTPPMGWNSWNCWGVDVDEQKVKSSAQAMIDKGLIDHGWNYINIDDGWESETRNTDGTIGLNKKFANMKQLSNWIHNNGLKLGIYSSPGPRTCGWFLGSFEHEMQDATTYAEWGIDYLKYDWCFYDAKGDTSLAAYMKPYRVMQEALRSQKRDIVYSLCQYGMKSVWKWGKDVDGNVWRTTGDITDTWKSLSSIGFNYGLEKTSAYAAPGRWNDPDMLIVGRVGWGTHTRPTRLTYDEQYLHISLWSLMAAPLLIGCDMSRLDYFTLNLLTNDEVIAINQDVLGKAAERMIKKDNYEVWVKPMSDGSKAVGIFNLDNQFRNISVDASAINVKPNGKTRDVWRQKNMGLFGSSFKANVPPHGVVLVRVY